MSEFLPPTIPTSFGTTPQPNASRPLDAGETDAATLRRLGQEFEASFLTEMLKHSGVGRMPASFNGGAGEAAFSDFLTREYAETIAESRSIGIAERVHQTLLARSSS